MSIARTTIRSARALHTSTRLLADSNPSSPSSSLGFSDYSNRTRKLPSIPISPSSKQNLLRPTRSDPNVKSQQSQSNLGQREGGVRGRDPRNAKRHPGEFAVEQDRQRKKRQDRSPVQASLNKARQDRQQSAEGGEGGDEFFVATPSRGRANVGGKGNKMKKVDLDLASVSISSGVGAGATASPGARTRTPRGSGSNDRRPKVAPRPKERVAEVEDRSPAGIFGRMSLLFPIRRGAREAERSVWAENMKPDEGEFQSRFHP